MRLKTLRTYLLDVVNSQTQQVVAVQKFFGLPKKNPIIHTVMFIGSCLGNEIMFASFFPILYYCVNADLARREVILWSVMLYIGQYIKDLLALPRPASPPVIRLEKHYETEYGLPSTHAFSSLCMSVYLNYFVYTRYEDVPLWLCVAIVMLWITSCCMSRIYLGVHSPIDVYVGLGLGVMLLTAFMMYIDAIDIWICQNNHIAVFAIPLTAVLMMTVYPRADKWNSSMGDTVRIVASGFSAIAASVVTYPYADDPHKKMQIFIPTSAMSYFIILMRIVVGLLVLAITRHFVKRWSYKYVPQIVEALGLAKAEEPGVRNDQRYITEIPCVFLTYGTLAFNCLFIGERLFPILGLSWDNVRYHSGVAPL